MIGTGLGAGAPPATARGGTGRRIAASGRIYVWPGLSLWIGSGSGVSDWHAHHAHQLALALRGDFRFRSRKTDGPWTRFDAAIVPSQCPHEFELEGATLAHLFVEPESAPGRALSHRYGAQGISALPQPAARQGAELLLRAFEQQADADAMQSVTRGVLAALAQTARSGAGAQIDARVARALVAIRSRIRAPVQLADAAAAATLSPSRFRHLFIQETGTTFRSYLLWLRINVAIEAAVAGASWTEAAHEAGFADSAHLSRTHKRMFGIEPTAIRQQ